MEGVGLWEIVGVMVDCGVGGLTDSLSSANADLINFASLAGVIGPNLVMMSFTGTAAACVVVKINMLANAVKSAC